MRPIIGITVAGTPDPQGRPEYARHGVTRGYADAVAAAGGCPILVPPPADAGIIAGLIDGWLIPGGDDIPGAFYGQDTHPEARTEDPERISLEQALFAAVRPDLPILGICYGCQLLNVLNGGTLHQHLPDVVGHEGHSGGAMQDYRLVEGSLAARSLGTAAPQGRSYHHQAVDQVADSLRAAGWSEDGTLEALEDASGRWRLGIQWHPERTLDDAGSRALFAAFIEEARRARKE
jgi:gamma-glutamyl-gamma-aminobutyrate hydrolase PuuD